MEKTCPEEWPAKMGKDEAALLIRQRGIKDDKRHREVDGCEFGSVGYYGMCRIKDGGIG